MTGSPQTWTPAKAKVPHHSDTRSNALYCRHCELSVVSLFPPQVQTVRTQPAPGLVCSSPAGLWEAVQLQSFKVLLDSPEVADTLFSPTKGKNRSQFAKRSLCQGQWDMAQGKMAVMALIASTGIKVSYFMYCLYGLYPLALSCILPNLHPYCVFDVKLPPQRVST